MTAHEGAGACRTIDDARALLDALLANGWSDLHVRTGTLEAFIARERGVPDPMSGLDAVQEPAPAGRECSYLQAPHVATLVHLVAIGSYVSAGERAATLRVLDEELPLLATFGGVVMAHGAAVGDLLDYGVDVIGLEAAA